MRQGKSVSPNYALNWWKKQASSPPKRDPVEFLSTRVKWRYAKGIPDQSNGKMVLGNSISELRNLYQGVEAGEQVRFNLLFTSPPYCGITDYYYDQWLRLWMLGGPPQAVHYNLKYQDDFYSKADYSDMLQDVFRACAKLLTKEATIYVRTDAREYTFKTTLCALKEAFPNKRVVTLPRPFTKSTQTALFGDKSDKPGEMDIIMRS